MRGSIAVAFMLGLLVPGYAVGVNVLLNAMSH
jgi:hypothetical protein